MSDLIQSLATALVDRYEIVREIGRGGMAVIFLAQDLRHSRRVAIKVMRPDLDGWVGAERFLREIQIAAQLSHPNILPLYDSGAIDGVPYFVMPYIDEESLRDRLSRAGPLPLPEAVSLIVEIADALAYAHAHGVVHRDVKPGNILLSAGHALLADFGVARAREAAGGSPLTLTGSTVGTPLYMSPEQFTGADPLDGRSDTYSLACVTMEVLTGAPPFAGLPPAVLLARKLAEIPDFTALASMAPPAVVAAIRSALQPDPNDRPRPIKAFADALSAALPHDGDAGHAPVTGIAGVRHSLAVLPFSFPAGRPDDEILADGITEDLIHILSRVGGIRVVARTSAFAFKGVAQDVRTIGNRLDVGLVVEGSVRKRGDRLRVTASLVDAESGFDLWSQQIERDVVDFFSLQDTITHEIASRLSGVIAQPKGEVRKASAIDFRAYEEFLRGRHFWNQRTEAGIRRSLECYGQALTIDGNFALALAGMAESYVTLALYGLDAPVAVMPAAIDAARRALELDATAGEPHAALGCARAVFQWDWARAEGHFQEALRRNQNYATAHHWYAINCLAPRGRFAEAADQLNSAALLDPLSASVRVSIGFVHYLERDFELAEASFRDVLESDPGFPVAHLFLGQSLSAQGRHEEAVCALRHAVEASDRSPETLAGLAYELAVSGDRVGSDEVMTSLLARRRDRHIPSGLLAMVFVGRQELDRAYEQLATALEERAAELIWLGVRPVWDPIRTHRCYEDIAARLGLGSLPCAGDGRGSDASDRSTSCT